MIAKYPAEYIFAMTGLTGIGFFVCLSVQSLHRQKKKQK